MSGTTNGNGTNKNRVIVDNMGPWVQAARAQFAAFERMEAEVKNTKQQLRVVAESLIPVGNAGIVEFKGPDGSLSVTLKDPSSDGNRVALSHDAVREAERAGIMLDTVTETYEEVRLTGHWVEWFLQALRHYTGKCVPEGWTHKKITRLSRKGVEILKTSKDPSVQALLRAGLMTSSVKEAK